VLHCTDVPRQSDVKGQECHFRRPNLMSVLPPDNYQTGDPPRQSKRAKSDHGAVQQIFEAKSRNRMKDVDKGTFSN